MIATRPLAYSSFYLLIKSNSVITKVFINHLIE